MTCPPPAEFPLSTRPIVAFTGPFGTGKTEVAINYALVAMAKGRASCIIDLDVVTPYFRVGDYRRALVNKGLRVIAPQGSLASFELPALPPEIATALRQDDLHVVLDVGGDRAGAHLLGAYSPEIAARGCDLWMVLNPFRPAAASPKAVADQARAIEESSRLRLTGLVANPHLHTLTRPAHLQSGWDRVCLAADRLRLPIVFLAVAEDLADQCPVSVVPVLPLTIMLRLPWQSP